MKRDGGAIYHVMNRGDRREAIFRDDRTWEMFLETVAGAHTRADWEVHPGASWIAGKAGGGLGSPVEEGLLKVRIAQRLRAEATMTLQWIADGLKMGTWTHISNRLCHLKQ